MPGQRSEQIRAAFQRYVKSGNDGLIKKITRDELEFAIADWSVDKGAPYYTAMKSRLINLKEKEAQTRAGRQKWLDRVFTFVLAVLATLAAQWLWKMLWSNAQ